MPNNAVAVPETAFCTLVTSITEPIPLGIVKFDASKNVVVFERHYLSLNAPLGFLERPDNFIKAPKGVNVLFTTLAGDAAWSATLKLADDYYTEEIPPHVHSAFKYEGLIMQVKEQQY